ncbi:histidine phosphatase family protein [Roseisalinus antarcticus]|uniref:Phosphoserine phosphatase 1 n=1 Tax=Roseisalinus antarcticus TaxID=254357 RepID=A0A1Y5RHU4_9RHOB|nr:histidine phosphatase family protein [Roseisalinus antarcticus]SLN17900.1 Phosphoserine phosphatase 1 [Roseisalinus antarcticus]
MHAFPELYVLRHGETEWNREGRWQGAQDSPLTARGRAQAEAMGMALASLGVGPDTHDLRHSLQGRARDTALAVSRATGLGMIADDRLREIGVGAWSGLLRSEIARDWPAPDPHEHFLETYARAPGGEPFDALWARAVTLLGALSRPTVLVTHGITSRFIRTAALGLGMDRLDEVPGGQGVIFRLAEGGQEMLDPAGLAPLAKGASSG